MTNKILNARIVDNFKIAENVWTIVLEYPDYVKVRPGQFVNVYLNRKDMLLPRPISICRAEGSCITLIYGIVGKGTEELSTYQSDTLLRLSTPLGNGYDLKEIESESERELSAMLVGGGLGIPPLLELTYTLVDMGVIVHAVIGCRHEPILEKELRDAGAAVYVATDDGCVGFCGDVLELITKEELSADYYFACGPQIMLQALTQHCMSYGKDVQVSLEERMGCGYGACVGCVCNVKETSTTDGEINIVKKRICKDGPVFWGKEVVWNG